MLLRYIASNFKSIGQQIEFSMLPTLDSSPEQGLRTVQVGSTKFKILQKGVLFGANAAGKSNFVESMRFARDYIVWGQRSGCKTGVEQFGTSIAELDDISSFQFTLYAQGQIYDYGFSLDLKQVHEEKLTLLHDDGISGDVLFVRTTDADGKTSIEFDPKLVEHHADKQKLVEVLKHTMEVEQKNVLFLNKLRENGIARAKLVVDWFSKLQFVFPNTSVYALPQHGDKGAELGAYLSDKLSQLGVGITVVEVKSKHVSFDDLDEVFALAQRELDSIDVFEQGILLSRGKCFVFAKDAHGISLVQIKFEHQLHNQAVKFNLEDESSGTQRLISLLVMLFNISVTDYIYVVDDLDRSLHPKVVAALIEEFSSMVQSSHSQLIATAHDALLINDLRQDEVWLVEKNELGESSLTPLSDFDLDAGKDHSKSYLGGRFGAVPF